MRQGSSITLTGGPAAVPAARKAVEAIGADAAGERLDDLRLLVSELVTNSVRHAGMGPDDRITLRVERPDEYLRVEVCDCGSGWDDPSGERRQDPEEPGGWGLFLVEHVADRWGVEQDGRTCVWFELDCRAGSESLTYAQAS
jgi:anti-sigma regulatory factor (Ser/Thr protein kinase)